MRPSTTRGTSVVVFPLDRRCLLIRNLAKQMIDRSPADAESHLEFELARHGRLLMRRQVSDAAIDAQLRALRNAVRRELKRRVIEPRGQRPAAGEQGGDA